MDKDLFEDMKNRRGCSYISDLPFHKRRIWRELKHFPLSAYPENQKQDFFHYVFDMDYAIASDRLHLSDI